MGEEQEALQDADPDPGEDPWFVPAPLEEDDLSLAPRALTARKGGAGGDVWLVAEAAEYRALVRAAEAVARLGERLRVAPEGLAERLALTSVAAVLRGEGVWIGPERIALYRALRLGVQDSPRDLQRASWAVRRLTAPDMAAPQADVGAFLGAVPGASPGAGGGERSFAGFSAGLGQAHPLTRAAALFTRWRAEEVTAWEDLLEPMVAAMCVGAGGLAPFLPMAAGRLPDRVDSGSTDARLAAFCAAAEAGALAALLELDRLADWQTRALAVTGGLSGRVAPRLVTALLCYPLLSADLAAAHAGCSGTAARRNLDHFTVQGLVREITGQDRYRFWTVV